MNDIPIGRTDVGASEKKVKLTYQRTKDLGLQAVAFLLLRKSSSLRVLSGMGRKDIMKLLTASAKLKEIVTNNWGQRGTAGAGGTSARKMRTK